MFPIQIINLKIMNYVFIFNNVISIIIKINHNDYISLKNTLKSYIDLKNKMNNKLYQIDKIYRKTLIQYKFNNISLKLYKDTWLTTTINDNNYLYEEYLMKLGKFGIKLYVVLYHKFNWISKKRMQQTIRVGINGTKVIMHEYDILRFYFVLYIVVYIIIFVNVCL